MKSSRATVIVGNLYVVVAEKGMTGRDRIVAAAAEVAEVAVGVAAGLRTGVKGQYQEDLFGTRSLSLIVK